MSEPGKLLDTKEVIDRYPISRSKLEHDRSLGKLAHYRIGKRCYYRIADIEAYIETHRRGPLPGPQRRKNHTQPTFSGGAS